MCQPRPAIGVLLHAYMGTVDTARLHTNNLFSLPPTKTYTTWFKKLEKLEREDLQLSNYLCCITGLYSRILRWNDLLTITCSLVEQFPAMVYFYTDYVDEKKKDTGLKTFFPYYGDIHISVSAYYLIHYHTLAHMHTMS